MFNIFTKRIELANGQVIELETGKIARQATGSVMAKMGNTVVLCTVVGADKPKEGVSFFPLTVNYIEKFYAAGKIPGGFNKRESRPSDRETLTSRLIDRPIRPLFPDNFYNEVQIMCTTMSYDPECQPDIVALIGASAALALSGIPFEAPIAAARVGYKDGEYLLNPSAAQIADGSLLELIVAGTEKAVLMVESEAKELSEEIMLGAVMFGHKQFKGIIKAIKEFAKEAGKPSWKLALPDHSALIAAIKTFCSKRIVEAYSIKLKSDRSEALSNLHSDVLKEFVEGKEHSALDVNFCFKKLEKDFVRGKIIKGEARIDGRDSKQVRKIVSEVDLLPNAHGSALFTRGETQVIAAMTLGSGADEQIIDDIENDRKERFMLHYNFPPYSVGETGMLRAPGRREIGHGKLAFRAISPLLPSKEDFPYTIRIVCEVTESNGSSSMATVCSSSMAMMAAGVPLSSPVAGIAMGLILENKDFVVLSDILGDEDHLGDMDFKVAGTTNGITALQMDIKIAGITENIMEQALGQAKDGRLHILGEMAKTIQESRTETASHAPQIKTVAIPKDKIGELIGPGGRNIKDIVEKSKAKIDISDEGIVSIAATTAESMQIALKMVEEISFVPEVGIIYPGKVTKIMDFGAFVAIAKGTEGLVHVSEIQQSRVERVSDILSVGDQITVRVLEIDRAGKIRLSMKGLNGSGESAGEEGGDDKVVHDADNMTSTEDSQPSFTKKKFGGRSGGGERRNDRGPRPSNNGERNRDGGERSANTGERSSREDRGGERRNDRNDRGGNRDRDDRGGNDRSYSQSTEKKKRFF